MKLSENWSWGGESNFRVGHLQLRGSVRYVTMVLAVCILRYASNICEQGRKGTQVLYYIVISMYVLRRTINIEVTSNIDIILV